MAGLLSEGIDLALATLLLVFILIFTLIFEYLSEHLEARLAPYEHYTAILDKCCECARVHGTCSCVVANLQADVTGRHGADDTRVHLLQRCGRKCECRDQLACVYIDMRTACSHRRKRSVLLRCCLAVGVPPDP